MSEGLQETNSHNIFIIFIITLFAIAFLAPLFKQKKVRSEIKSITKQENQIDVLRELMFKAGLSLSRAIRFAVGGIITTIVFLELENQFPQVDSLILIGLSICLLTIYSVVYKLIHVSLYLKGAKQIDI